MGASFTTSDLSQIGDKKFGTSSQLFVMAFKTGHEHICGAEASTLLLTRNGNVMTHTAHCVLYICIGNFCILHICFE